MADQLHHTLKSCGAPANAVSSPVGAIGWSTLFSVFIQLLPLLENSVPKVLAMINDIVVALKAGGFNWTTVAALYAKDKDAVIAIVSEIAAALGVAVPQPGPVVP